MSMRLWVKKDKKNGLEQLGLATKLDPMSGNYYHDTRETPANPKREISK